MAARRAACAALALLLLAAPARGALDDSLAECFATRGCGGAESVNASAALLRGACVAGRPALALLFVGQVASWSTQSVYESFQSQVAGPNAWAAQDAYFCVGKEVSDERPASAWRAAFAGLNVVAAAVGSSAPGAAAAQAAQCYGLLAAVEAAAGCSYTAILRSFPHLEWTAPAALQAAAGGAEADGAEAVFAAGGEVAICPRATATSQQPCCTALPGCHPGGREDAPPLLFQTRAVPVRGARAPAAPPSLPTRALGGAARPQRVALVLVGRPKQDKYEYGLFFESYRARVIDKYRRDGHSVDVFLCSAISTKDALGNLVLTRLQPYTVFDVEAKSQFERQDKCYAKIKAHAAAAGGEYDWYFRSRPDLVLWDDAPSLEGLDESVIHARVLSAANWPGLSYGSFSYDWESDKCWPDVCLPGECAAADAPCAVFDDQLAVVPRAMADIYFFELTNSEGHAPWVPNGRECEWTRGGFPEHFFMRNTLGKGGRFAGLSLESRLLGYKGDVPKRENEGKAKPCPPWHPPPPTEGR